MNSRPAAAGDNGISDVDKPVAMDSVFLGKSVCKVPLGRPDGATMTRRRGVLANLA